MESVEQRVCGHVPPGLVKPVTFNNEEVEESQISQSLQMLSIARATEFPTERHRWNTNEEIASVLLAVENHVHWESVEVQVRPPSGSMILYNRNKVRYRKDGYVWKKRKDGKTTREDHMKLKVQGVECIYGCYVHSAVMSTFHRRCYWLLQDQDMVVVHYLNVPLVEDSCNKPTIQPPLLTGLSPADEREWSEDDLLDQLRPMFASAKQTESCNITEQLTEGMLKDIVRKLLGSQKTKANKCCCPEGKKCKRNCKKTCHISPRGESSGVTAPQRMMSLLHSKHTTTSPAKTTNLLINSSIGTGNMRTSGSSSSTPLILNLSQLQGSNGLIILSSQTGSPISIINSSSNHSNLVPSHQTDSKPTADAVHNVDKPDPRLNSGQNVVFTETSAPAANLDLSAIKSPTLQTDSFSNSFLSNNDLNTDIADVISMDKHTDYLPAPMTSEPNPELTSKPALEAYPSSMAHTALGDLYREDTLDILNMLDFDCPSDLALTSGDTHTAECSTIKSDPPAISSAGCVGLGGEKAESRVGIANITDFSPDWSYTQGGTKILVTGPWYSTTSPYSILFDGVAVNATLVQSGVLRSFCPGHSAGLVSMQVACEGFVISNSCVFEYKSPSLSIADQVEAWFSTPKDELEQSLLRRLDQIEQRLSPASTHTTINTTMDHLEQCLVEQCERLSSRSWLCVDPPLSSTPHLTLLHLVAALGYTRLLSALTTWKAHNWSSACDAEMDPMATDEQMCTPLMWACARGHFEAAILLYQQDNSSLNVCNKHGLLPVSVARLRGHTNVAEILEKLDLARREMKAEKVESEAPSEPVQVTLVHTSTGMVLTPVSALPTRPHSEQLRVDVTHHPQPTTTASSSQSFSFPTSVAPSVSPIISHCLSSTVSSTLSPSVSSSVSSKISSSVSPSTARHLRLMKRSSVEVLPDFSKTNELSSNSSKCSRTEEGDAVFKRPHERSRTEPPDLPSMTSADPMISMSHHDLNSPLMFSHMDILEDPTLCLTDLHHDAMDTDSPESHSPVGVDIDGILPVDIYNKSSSLDEVQHQQMVTLATQIIAAMPERIKSSPGPTEPDLLSGEIAFRRDRTSSYGSLSSSCSAATPPNMRHEDSGISTPLGGISFDSYRGEYTDLGTPSSSLSPASSCLHSPYSFNLDSPPPTTADFTEYFNAPTFYMERDFSQLTLSDEEQRRLYHAAHIIQNFYRRYKDKKEQKQREMEAAILIQSYYRRYKQYMYYKKMSQAAVLIQSQFRTYYAQKRFRKSREAATIIQNRYRAYKEQERFKKSHSAAVIIQQRFRNHYQRKRCGQGGAGKVQDMLVEPDINSETSSSAVDGGTQDSTEHPNDAPKQ